MDGYRMIAALLKRTVTQLTASASIASGDRKACNCRGDVRLNVVMVTRQTISNGLYDQMKCGAMTFSPAAPNAVVS